MTFDIDNIPPQIGRTAVVTGANAGIGKETARALARTGITVVMACRDAARAEAARAEIQSDVPDGRLEVMALDLASNASVRAFAEGFRATHDKLDVLINNAGVMFPPPSQSEDGIEIQMAANYVGHFLLTALLLDRLPDSPASRIISVSSLAHRSSRLDAAELRAGRGALGGRAYGQSKLACLMFALELDRRLRRAGRRTLSLAAHPGLSVTEIGKHVNPLISAAFRYTVFPLVTHAPARAALPLLQAALGDGVTGGQYFGPQGWREVRGGPGPARIAPQARDEAAGKALWDASEDLAAHRFDVEAGRPCPNTAASAP